MHGLINTPSGSILLRVGDNVTTDANSQITAGHYIDICGDYRRFPGEARVCGNFDAPDPAVTDSFDPGVGTVMHFAGEMTPGTLGARLTWITRIFGNADNDSIFFDQTDLDGKTRAYGSNRPTDCLGDPPGLCGVNAPAGDGLDYFEVNQLETMDVAGGHTLTLDGQAGHRHVRRQHGRQPRHRAQLRDQRPRHGREGRRPRHADRQRHRRSGRLPDAPGLLDRHRRRTSASSTRRRRPSSRSCTARSTTSSIVCARTSSASTTTRTSTRG